MFRTSVFAAALVLASAGLARGQSLVDTSYAQPDEDRWNYPFNFTPGARFTIPTFAALNIPGFDDYDAQMIIGFDTSALIPPGLGVDAYHIESVTVTASVGDSGQFVYDPTLDELGTYFPTDDPDFVADGDTGRPVELFAVGYRGSFADGTPVTIATWTESSAFGGTPVVSPAEGSRFAFAAVLDESGQRIDVSNRIKERFEAEPFAVGQAAGVSAGGLVPPDTTFSFELARCQSGADRYLRESLDAGVLRFTIASLQPSSDPAGGPVVPNYPVWYSRENPLAVPGFTATLHIRVRVGVNAADLSSPANPGVPDGVLTGADFFEFLNRFQAGDLSVDYAGPTTPNEPDCQLTGADFFAFLSLFAQG